MLDLVLRSLYPLLLIVWALRHRLLRLLQKALPLELYHSLVSPSDPLPLSDLGPWQDLLPRILTFLNPVDPEDSAALAKCMRVSKAFQVITAPILYHTYTLGYNYSHEWYAPPTTYGLSPPTEALDHLKQGRIRSVWIFSILHRLAPAAAERICTRLGLLDFLDGKQVAGALPLTAWDRLRLIRRIDVYKKRTTTFYTQPLRRTGLPLPSNGQIQRGVKLPILEVLVLHSVAGMDYDKVYDRMFGIVGRITLDDFLRTEVPFAVDKLVIWNQTWTPCLSRFDYASEYGAMMTRMPGHIASSLKKIIGFTNALLPIESSHDYPDAIAQYGNLDSIKIIYGNCWSAVHPLTHQSFKADCARALLALTEWLKLATLLFSTTNSTAPKMVIVGLDALLDPSGLMFDPLLPEDPSLEQAGVLRNAQELVKGVMSVLNEDRKQQKGPAAPQIQVELQTYAEYFMTDEWRTEVPRQEAMWMQRYDEWIAKRRERVQSRLEAELARQAAETARRNQKKKQYHGKGSYSWK